MSDFDAWLMGFLLSLCLVIGIVGGGLFVVRIHDQAAQTSCAQYNPTTGDFEWIKEKSE